MDPTSLFHMRTVKPKDTKEQWKVPMWAVTLAVSYLEMFIDQTLLVSQQCSASSENVERSFIALVKGWWPEPSMQNAVSYLLNDQIEGPHSHFNCLPFQRWLL